MSRQRTPDYIDAPAFPVYAVMVFLCGLALTVARIIRGG